MKWRDDEYTDNIGYDRAYFGYDCDVHADDNEFGLSYYTRKLQRIYFIITFSRPNYFCRQ